MGAKKKSDYKQDKLAVAIDQFFNQVVEDPLIGLYFEDTDISSLKKRFSSYIGHLVSDTEDEYEGQDVYNAHRGRDITDEASDLFTRMLVEALRAAGLSATDVDRVEKKLWGMQELIVGRFVPSGAYIYKPQKFN